jgi:cysteine desulfurase
MIYLDYAATSPMRREAVEAYVEAASQTFGNTQSLHDHGTKAAHYVNSCKAVFGELLNARADGFYFTGNASEGNQLAIRSILRGRPKSCNVIITTYLEHASVLTTMHELEKEGYVVRYAPVNQNGVADIAWIANEVNDKTALIVLQMVNSEIGAIQPVKECMDAGNTYGVPVHCDMVQAFGKYQLI